MLHPDDLPGITTDATGAPSAAPLVPDERTLPRLREAAAMCTGCGIYKRATQTVFGLGDTDAELMLVGEQPGDKEDLAGEPFVGPAGKLLDSALREAGIDRGRVYVTNAVKHFKWRPTAKRRLHEKPNQVEIRACRPWLEAELEVVQPRILVCLGATAAQAIIGPDFRVTRSRGQFLATDLAPVVMATVHPSSILRAVDEAARRSEMGEFIRDLALVPPMLEELRAAG